MSNPYPTFLMLDIEGSSKIARSLSRQEYLERVNIPVYAELKRLIARHQGDDERDAARRRCACRLCPCQ